MVNSINENKSSTISLSGNGRRIIIAGGGTGGHIFPAIAIANALKKKDANTEILFIGAKGKMEMEKVPQAGYAIEGLEIVGYNRHSFIKNIGLPLKLIKSFFQVQSIMKKFKPDAVIGVGGYSSYPVLKMAQAKGVPTFIHESNSFAGKSNILLGKNATKVFTGTEGMEKFFPKHKIIVTGNPVRESIVRSTISKNDGLKYFSLNENKKTVLVVGGSLGAQSINEAILQGLDKLTEAGLQLIWQTGKKFVDTATQAITRKNGIWANDFISEMQYAYAAADIVVARSGAMTVAELSAAKKAVLFVPYPFAAEDHQMVNAMLLVNKNAALMVRDSEVKKKLVFMTIELSMDESKQNELRDNIGAFVKEDAAFKISEEIVKSFKK